MYVLCYSCDPPVAKKPILASEFHDLLGLVTKMFCQVFLDFFFGRCVTDCTGTKTTMKHHHFGRIVLEPYPRRYPAPLPPCIAWVALKPPMAKPCLAALQQVPRKDCLTVCVEDGFSFGKAGGECA